MNENTYWNHKGKYQEWSRALRLIVPETGRCTDTRIESYRCMANLYYDLYNNGLCNLEHCYQEEWWYICAFQESLYDKSVKEISAKEFGDLRLLMQIEIFSQEEVEGVDSVEYGINPKLYELFEKLLNATIKWVHTELEENK